MIDPSGTPAAGEKRAADSSRHGTLAVGLFLPQYFEDPLSHELRGRGTGAAGIEIARALAARLGAGMRIVGYPTPAAVIESLKAGLCQLAFLGIEPSRAAELDFSPPIFEFDYACLVPAGSAIASMADMDRPGIRIAVVRDHASTLALSRVMKRAELAGFDLPDAAFAALGAQRVDALAFPRDVLLDFSLRLPGSRVVPDAYGTNRVGIAIAKGDPERLASIGEFVAGAKASGLVRRIIEAAGLRGFRVA